MILNSGGNTLPAVTYARKKFRATPRSGTPSHRYLASWLDLSSGRCSDMAAQDVPFRISSALKTILGKELITDEFIAIFELVKNSFDANARRVDITFDGLDSGSPKIVIQDDGDGMDEDDIRRRWLFVAYSAKSLQETDYRDKIRSSRVFAGAKGIGRFSCDRLGGTLSLYTRKRGDRGANHVLTVDWSHFEKDPEK